MRGKMSFTTTDSSKLHLKNRLEEHMAQLEEYDSRDQPDYPGWTFLLSDVVKEYGICPFLNVDDEGCRDRRLTWLQEQKDAGKIYFEAVSRLSDRRWLQDIEDETFSLKKQIQQHVTNVVESLNEQSLSTEEGADNFIDHDSLIDSIRLRKEAKSQNKTVKEAWNKTLRSLDYIMLQRGVDFSKYISIIYGYVIRYKPPPSTNVDSEFEHLYNRYIATNSKLQSSRQYVEQQKEEAKQQLISLIKQNFQLDQVRRYHKKWSSLTSEKKEERIKSYCDWYARQNNKPLTFAETMKTFIMEKMESKELKVMDVKWDIKLGIITNVNISITNEGKFELKQRAPRILKSPRRSSKKKRDKLFENEEGCLLQQRINRLLLFEMLKGQTLKKELVVQSVIRNLRTRLLTENQVADYVSSKYDDVLETLKNTPFRV